MRRAYDFALYVVSSNSSSLVRDGPVQDITVQHSTACHRTAEPTYFKMHSDDGADYGGLGAHKCLPSPQVQAPELQQRERRQEQGRRAPSPHEGTGIVASCVRVVVSLLCVNVSM